MLAVQNMVAYNAVSKTHEVEFKALESSLNMMSKGGCRPSSVSSLDPDDFPVLNDVLDL